MSYLPKRWVSRSFFDAIVLQRGFDLPISARKPGAVAVLGSNGQVGTHDQKPPGVPIPTLTVGRSGSVGKVCYSEAGCWPLNTTLFAADYCGNHPKYMYYWLQHFDLSRYAQGVSVPTLNRNTFRDVQVSVPPIEEQRAIADVLDQCWDCFTTEGAAEKLAFELKRSSMRELFARGLSGEPRQDTELGSIPRSWKSTRIAEVATKLQYGLSVRGQPKGQYPILRMNCQQDGEVIFRDLQYVDLDAKVFTAFKLDSGDLLFNRTNSIEHVGRTAIFKGARDAVFASYLIRLAVDAERCRPAYLNYYMNMPSAQAEIKKLASRAVGQANINASKLRTFAFPLPLSVEEQDKIVSVLEAIDRKINLHREKRALLEDLFKVLRHNLMTGEISVSDLDLSALESKSEAVAA